MSAVDGPTGTTVIQYANMDQALAAGDIEAVILMLGIERAKTAEDVVKTKIQTIKANNAKIQELNTILQKMQGKDDKKDTSLGITEADKTLLTKYGINVGDYMDGTKVKADGKLALLRESISNQVKQMSSNDQLDMIELQSAVSKQNNAIEMVSTIVKKFADLKDSIVRKFG
ncbi:MAG TPA: hypothetical protein PKA13_19375 [Geminicoccaceae bacterium]|nr:hypothetical protein [Geminicoccus sp.]HMU51946.1 hypothetical protein [Geminicoccaceae bacterium]